MHKSKKKPAPKPKQDTRPILVVTSLGNSILPRESKVLVKLGKDTYARKCAEDLREGEKVLYEKEGIDIEEQKGRINELLGNGRRYRNAMASLFLCTDEVNTPVFRAELLRGILERPDEWPEGLVGNQSAVHRVIEGKEILPEELRSLAAERIHSTLTLGLEDFAKPVTREHIESGWLAGSVIAPRDFKDVFWALGKMAPGLVNLLGTPQFEKDYWMYRAMRQSIMLRLSNIMRGDGKPAEDQKNKTNNAPHLDADARQELDRIVEFFAEDCDTKYAIASVVSAKPVRAANEETSNNGKTLRKGIVSKKPDGTRFNVLEPERVNQIAHILRDYVDLAFTRFIMQKNQFSERAKFWYRRDLLFEKIGYGLYPDRIKSAILKIRNARIDRVALSQELFEPYFDQRLATEDIMLVDEFYENIVNGNADRWFGLDCDATMKMLEESARYITARPIEVDYYEQLMTLNSKLIAEGFSTRKIIGEIEIAEEKVRVKGWGQPIRTSRMICNSLVRTGLEDNPGLVLKLKLAGFSDSNMRSILLARFGAPDHRVDAALTDLESIHSAHGRSILNVTGYKWIMAPEKHALLAEVGLLEIAKKIQEETYKEILKIRAERKKTGEKISEQT